MNKKLFLWITLGTAFAGMGISMPSCPGQQAMQQQIDELKTKNSEMANHIRALESQTKNVTAELTQAKVLIEQIGKTVLEQNKVIEEIKMAAQAQAAAKQRTAVKAPGKAVPRHLPKAVKRRSR